MESRIVSRPNELMKFQFAVKLGLLEAGVLPYIGFPGNIYREQRLEGLCLITVGKDTSQLIFCSQAIHIIS